jgi:hypothetical protein
MKGDKMHKVMRNISLFTLAVPTIMLLLASPALALYTQPASTLAGGGGSASSANYKVIGVIAQPGIVGNSESGSYNAGHGFLPALGGWRILYPVIFATPGILTFTLAPGSSADQPLAVSNAGGSALKWSVAKGNPSETYFTVSPSTGAGNASITVTANATGLTPDTYSDTLTVSGAGISQTFLVQLTLNVSQSGVYRLTMTVVSDTDAKGGGSVHSDVSGIPGGIACSNTGSAPGGISGVCHADFSSGTTVTLTQSPDPDSTWATWSYDNCGTNQNCPVTMDDNRKVTATFPYAHMATVNSTGIRYDSLAEALTSAKEMDTILSRDVTFIENLTLSGKAITLDGGVSAWYKPQNAWTTLQGMLTIQSGSLTVDKLVIKSPP